jgi:WD40 repeat protein
MQSHGAYITSIAFSPNGAMIASAGADDAFDWSNIDGSSAGHSGSYVGPCDAVAFAPDNSTIVAGCSSGVETWVFGVPSDEADGGLGNAPAQINDLAFSPDHSGQVDHFAVATAHGVELWPYDPNGNDHECCTDLPSSASAVNLAYSPNGHLLAGISQTSVNGSGHIEVWNVGSDKLLTSFADPYALQVAFSADGNTLAISTLMGIQFYNMTTGHLSLAIKYAPNSTALGPGGALAYSPNGSILAFADGWNKIGLWSLASGKLVGSLPASASGQGLVYALAFSPNSMYLASGGGNQVCDGACDDPSVHLWNVSSFTQ